MTAEASGRQHRASALTALIIEDLPAHALTAAAILRQNGFRCEIAKTLTAGLDRAELLFKNETAGPYPPVILLDLHLPLQDLKSSTPSTAMTEGAAIAAYLAPRLPAGALLVAFTSDPSIETHQEALLAGCRLVIQKPFSTRHGELLRALLEDRSVAVDEYLAYRCRPGDEAAALSILPDDSRRSSFIHSFQHVFQRAASALIQYARIASLGETESGMRWDQDRVRLLFFNYPDLLGHYPESRIWIERQGGIEKVYARIRQMAADAKFPQQQRRILEFILSHPVASDWDQIASAVGLAKSPFYRARGKLFQAIATELNTWT